MLYLTGWFLWACVFGIWVGWSSALEAVPHMASGGQVRWFAIASAYLLVAIMLAIADRVVGLMLEA